MVKGGRVVGFESGRHDLQRNFQVVYEGARILYVGPKFEGHVDETIDASGQLVSPGFIDTHVHSGHRALHKLISDGGRPDFFGQPYLEVAVPRRGTRIEGYPNYLTREEAGSSKVLELHSLFTVAELLRNGVTTFVELGSQVVVQEALWRQCERLGVRGYLGAGYDSGRWVGGDGGRLEHVQDEAEGLRAFREAVEFAKTIQEKGGELISPILVPRELDNCTVELLRRTARASRELGVPMATHASYNFIEFYETVRNHRMTPIELLESVEMLRPELNIGHANLIADNPRMNYSGARDLELMGRNRVSISHCPINIVRRARALDSWEKYQKAGVNITLGSDTYPRDMMMNMREASYHGKVMSHNLKAATAAEVFTAATLNGAKSLGRDDLGRLASGARADLICIDLSGRGTLRFGAVRDPIRSIVDCGVGDDVDTVIVNGVVRMRGGRIPGLDIDAVRGEAQLAAERIWSRLQNWDPLERTVDQMCPLSFCPDAERVDSPRR
jgi:cytosine/adenosine deaminase-related metal-dependent hydrolase